MKILISIAAATACSVFVALVVVASGRQPVLITTAAVTPVSSSTVEMGVITSGDATVSKKPDLAFIAVGVESQQSTASAAQSDLAGKAAKLIARDKALGIADELDAFFEINLAEDLKTKWFFTIGATQGALGHGLQQHTELAADPYSIPRISDGGAHARHQGDGRVLVRYLSPPRVVEPSSHHTRTINPIPCITYQRCVSCTIMPPPSNHLEQMSVAAACRARSPNRLRR